METVARGGIVADIAEWVRGRPLVPEPGDLRFEIGFTRVDPESVRLAAHHVEKGGQSEVGLAYRREHGVEGQPLVTRSRFLGVA